MTPEMVGFNVIFFITFLTLVLQDWGLKRMYNLRAWGVRRWADPWMWEIAGVSIAFGGFLVRITLSQTELIDPNVLRYVAMVTTVIAILCLIVSRHLLREYYRRLARRV